MLRKMGSIATPVVELIKNPDDSYTMNTTTTFKSSTISFKLGEEFDEETLDGRNVKTVITLDNNKLIQKQGGEKPSTIIREFTPEEMVATMVIGDVTAIRKYKAI